MYGCRRSRSGSLAAARQAFSWHGFSSRERTAGSFQPAIFWENRVPIGGFSQRPDDTTRNGVRARLEKPCHEMPLFRSDGQAASLQVFEADIGVAEVFEGDVHAIHDAEVEAA